MQSPRSPDCEYCIASDAILGWPVIPQSEDYQHGPPDAGSKDSHVAASPAVSSLRELCLHIRAAQGCIEVVILEGHLQHKPKSPERPHRWRSHRQHRSVGRGHPWLTRVPQHLIACIQGPYGTYSYHVWLQSKEYHVDDIWRIMQLGAWDATNIEVSIQDMMIGKSSIEHL